MDNSEIIKMLKRVFKHHNIKTCLNPKCIICYHLKKVEEDS